VGGAVLALPVIGLTLLIRALARPLFRGAPRAQQLIERYALWATIPIAAVALAFISLPLAITFVAVVVVFALFRKRRGLPFGFPSNSSGDRDRR
jgi:hypothetical protein